MREQLQRMDGDLWQARQELQAMQRQQQQLARKPVALRERPQSAHKPATAQDAGLQVGVGAVGGRRKGMRTPRCMRLCSAL